MSFAKNFLLLALVAAPLASHAAGVRSFSDDEIAVQKVQAALLRNDLKFLTTPSSNLCGNSGVEGTDVKVQVLAGDRYITIRHYGVTYPSFFSSGKALECAQ